MKFKAVVSAIFFFLISVSAWGTAYSWTGGGAAGDWTDSGNWTPSGSPLVGDEVSVSTAAPVVFINVPSINLALLSLSGTATWTSISSLPSSDRIVINCDVTAGKDIICNELSIGSGGTLNMAANILNISTSFANGGILKLGGNESDQNLSAWGYGGGGTIEFTSPGTGWAGLTTFNNLIVSGGTHAATSSITVNGTSTITSAISTTGNFTFTGASSVGANITSTGTQTYTGALTLTAAALLTASTVNFNNSVSGSYALTVNGNAVIAATGTFSVASLSVSGTSSIAKNNITTTGTQTYTGAVTGPGAGNDLTMTGNAVFGSAVGIIRNLRVTGTASIKDTVATAGTQQYDGNATLTSTGALTLSGTTVTFNGTLTGSSQDLTMTGNAVFGSAVGIIRNLRVTGTASIKDTVATAGTQQYDGNATLTSTGPLTLSGTTVTFKGTLAGNGQDLTISGNAVFGDAAADNVTAIKNLTVSGTSNIYTTTVTTTGTQTYGGAITLQAASQISVSASAVTFSSTVDGAQALEINAGSGAVRFEGNVGGTAPLTVITKNGTGTTTILASAVTTSGDQTWRGPVVIDETSTITGVGITFYGTLDAKDENESLTLTGSYTVNAAVGSSKAFDTLTLDGPVSSGNDISIRTTNLVFNSTAQVTTGGTKTITIHADTISGTYSVTRMIDGTDITIATKTAAHAIALIDTYTTALSITNTLLGYIYVASGSSLTIGATGTGGSGQIYVGNSGGHTFGVPLTLKSNNADLTFRSTAVLNLGSNNLTIEIGTGDIKYSGSATAIETGILNGIVITSARNIGASTAGNHLVTKTSFITGTGLAGIASAYIDNTGDINVAAAMGHTTGTPTSAIEIAATGAITQAAVVITATAAVFSAAGNITLDTPTNVIGTVSLTNSGTTAGNILFNNTKSTGLTVLTASNANSSGPGTITITEASGDVIVGSSSTGGISTDGGAISVTAGSTKDIKLYKNITSVGTTNTTNGGNITLSNAVLLQAGVSVSSGTGSGNITFSGTVNGAYSLFLTAGTGDITFSGAIGGTAPPTGLSTDAAASGNVVLPASVKVAGHIAINKPVTIGSATTIETVRTAVPADSNGNITFDKAISAGTNTLVLTSNGTGEVTLNGNVTSGAFTVNSKGLYVEDITINTSAAAAGNRNITFNVDGFTQTGTTGATINAGNGTFALAPFTPTKTVQFGDVDTDHTGEDIFYSSTFSNVTAGAMTIGNSTTGTIFLTSVSSSTYNLTLQNNADIEIHGNYSATSTTPTTTTLTITPQAISPYGEVKLKADATLTSLGGITINGAVSGNYNLTLTADTTKNIVVKGSVGGTTALTALKSFSSTSQILQIAGNIKTDGTGGISVTGDLAIITPNAAGTAVTGSTLSTESKNISITGNITGSGMDLSLDTGTNTNTTAINFGGALGSSTAALDEVSIISDGGIAVNTTNFAMWATKLLIAPYSDATDIYIAPNTGVGLNKLNIPALMLNKTTITVAANVVTIGKATTGKGNFYIGGSDTIDGGGPGPGPGPGLPYHLTLQSPAAASTNSMNFNFTAAANTLKLADGKNLIINMKDGDITSSGSSADNDITLGGTGYLSIIAGNVGAETSANHWLNVNIPLMGFAHASTPVAAATLSGNLFLKNTIATATAFTIAYDLKTTGAAASLNIITGAALTQHDNATITAPEAHFSGNGGMNLAPAPGGTGINNIAKVSLDKGNAAGVINYTSSRSGAVTIAALNDYDNAAGAITIIETIGTITIASITDKQPTAKTINGLQTKQGAISVVCNDTTSAGNTTITLKSDVNSHSNTTAANGGTITFGSSTTANKVVVGDSTLAATNVKITSGVGSGDINFSGTIDAYKQTPTDYDEKLTLESGNTASGGLINLGGYVGATEPLAELHIVSTRQLKKPSGQKLHIAAGHLKLGDSGVNVTIFTNGDTEEDIELKIDGLEHQGTGNIVNAGNGDVNLSPMTANKTVEYGDANTLTLGTTVDIFYSSIWSGFIAGSFTVGDDETYTISISPTGLDTIFLSTGVPYPLTIQNNADKNIEFIGAATHYKSNGKPITIRNAPITLPSPIPDPTGTGKLIFNGNKTIDLGSGKLTVFKNTDLIGAAGTISLSAKGGIDFGRERVPKLPITPETVAAIPINIDSDSASHNLTLIAGTADILINGSVGTANKLGAITIKEGASATAPNAGAANVTFTGTVKSSLNFVVNHTGILKLQDDVIADGGFHTQTGTTGLDSSTAIPSTASVRMGDDNPSVTIYSSNEVSITTASSSSIIINNDIIAFYDIGFYETAPTPGVIKTKNIYAHYKGDPNISTPLEHHAWKLTIKSDSGSSSYGDITIDGNIGAINNTILPSLYCKPFGAVLINGKDISTKTVTTRNETNSFGTVTVAGSVSVTNSGMWTLAGDITTTGADISQTGSGADKIKITSDLTFSTGAEAAPPYYAADVGDITLSGNLIGDSSARTLTFTSLGEVSVYAIGNSGSALADVTVNGAGKYTMATSSPLTIADTSYLIFKGKTDTEFNPGGNTINNHVRIIHADDTITTPPVPIPTGVKLIGSISQQGTNRILDIQNGFLDLDAYNWTMYNSGAPPPLTVFTDKRAA